MGLIVLNNLNNELFSINFEHSHYWEVICLMIRISCIRRPCIKERRMQCCQIWKVSRRPNTNQILQINNKNTIIPVVWLKTEMCESAFGELRNSGLMTRRAEPVSALRHFLHSAHAPPMMSGICLQWEFLDNYPLGGATVIVVIMYACLHVNQWWINIISMWFCQSLREICQIIVVGCQVR